MASQIKPSGDVEQRRPRIIDRKHLEFLRKLPCPISLRTRDIEAAHVRFADAERDKPQTGMQVKPDDKWSVPLCPYWHRTGPESQHAMDERKFWDGQNIDVLKLCEDLYAVSGDLDAGRKIVIAAHNGRYAKNYPEEG